MSMYEQIRQKVREKRFEQDVAKVDDEYLRRFSESAGSYLDSAKKDYDGLGYGNAYQSYLNRRDSYNDLDYRRRVIQEWSKRNPGVLDQESDAWLESFGRDSKGILDAFSGMRNYFAQFDSEDTYKQYLADLERWNQLTDGYDPTVNQAAGRAGWRRYQAAQANAPEQNETNDPRYWWKQISNLGFGSPDTAMIQLNTQQVAQLYREMDAALGGPDSRWSQEQQEIFGYLWGRDPAKAETYARAVNEMLNAQQEQEARTAIQEKATGGFGAGLVHTAGAILGGATGLADFQGDLIAKGAIGYIPTADGHISPFEYSQAVTGGIAENLNEKYGTLDEDALFGVLGGKGLGDLYGLGVSAAQSMAYGSVLGQVPTLITFFGSGAASAVDEAKARGATDEQALTFGAISGAAEVLTEMVPLDNLLNMGRAQDLKGLFWDIFKQGGEEFLGEGANSIITNVADYFTVGDLSTYNMYKQEYMEKGMDAKEAGKQAFRDIVGDIAFDALGGFVSGSASGGIVGGGSTLFHNAQVKKQYGEFQNELVQEALGIDAGNSFAQDMQRRLDRGKNLSGGQLSRLNSQIVESDIQAIQRASAQRLTELGETVDVDSIAAALAKQVAGEELSRAEERTIQNSRYGQRVANELSPKNIRSGGFASEWAQKIGTHRINAQEYGSMVQAAESAESVDGEGSMATVRESRMVAENATAAEKVNGKGVSEDGVTRQMSTGKEVTPQKIVSIENGKAMIQTDEGTIAADDIEFGTGDMALLWQSAADFKGINASGANGIIRLYLSGDNVAAYLHGAAQEFQNGYYNLPSGGENADKLTPLQRQTIYAIGQKAAGENVASAQAKAAAAKKQAVTADEKGAVGDKSATTGEVHFDRNGRSFDSVREVSLKAMDQLSRALGVEFYVYESYVNEARERVYKDAKGNEVHAPNGYYDPKDGSIHIDLNAGADGKGIMLFTIAHELTHFIKEWSPAKFKVLADFLVKQYAQKGENVNTLVETQIKKAKDHGRDLSWEDAYEEMVADSMEAMLTDGNVVQMMADLKQQDKTLWQKICDWFKDLFADLEAIVNAYKGVKPDSHEGKLVAQMQDVIVTLESLYADALADASENYQAARAEKNTTQDGGVDRETTVKRSERIVDQIRSSLSQIMALDSVYTIDASNATPYTSDWKTDEQSGHAVFKAQGGVANRAGFGRVILGKKGAVSTAFHGNGPAKQAVFPAIKSVIEQGIEIGRDYNHNGKGFDTVTFAAPVDFFESKAPLGVVVKVSINGHGDKSFYIHEICDAEGNYIQLEDSVASKKEFSSTGLVDPTSTASAADDGITPKTNVAQNADEVKEKFSDRDSKGNALSQEQQEFFKDSQIRDEQGRLMVMYHGTPNGNHTTFRPGTYFTPDRQYADVYQSPGASMLSTKKNVDNPKTYEAYLNIKKPFDTRKPKERRIFMQEYYRQWGTGAPLADSGLPDWTDGMDLQEFIEEMGYDYDGLILDEGATGGYGQEVKSRGLSYVVFSAEQVKDVSNKTPTSDPDIHLSERDPELQKVNRVLEKENAELKRDVAYLKELVKLQKQVTGGTKFTKSSVEAAAGQLIKYADAKGSKAELVPLLNSVYEYIARGQELTWDGVKEAAQPAVEWLQSHVRSRTERSTYAQDVLKEIRDSKVYLDEQQKQEVAYKYGSYNEFRKKAMGSVILTDSATMSLDSQWHEWAGQYPNLFDSNISSTDMPAALMDVFDGLRNMTEADYGYDQELFGQELLSRVYDSYWNVSTLYTVKDKAQKEINRLKFDHAGRMASLKEYHREQTAKLKQEHRQDLQRVRQEMREKAEKQRQGILAQHEASRKKGAENRHKAEMRRKIRRTVMDLKKILNKGDKKRNVKEDMKDLVAEALRSADVLFTDNYSNEDMVRNGVGADMTEQEAKYMAEAQSILAEIEGAGTEQERQEVENRLQGKLDYRIDKLKDVFTRERARLNKTTVAEVLGSLADAYKTLESSEHSYVSGAFDENVHQHLLGMREDVGGTTVKDMSLHQLEELHKAYTMVLTTVRNANKMFAANLKQSREQLGNQTIAEVQNAGGEHGLWAPGEDKISAFSWSNEKPVYAFERIGSETLTRLFENTRAGEDTWAQDMTEAREYYLQQIKKHRYDSWDFDKQYKFTSTSGIDFSLNLEQIMSLYAYSKREQAHDHLMKGGFVFDGNTEVQVNKMGVKLTYLNKTAKAHNVSPEILGDIVSKLSAEQKAFVDEMQDYLSTTMGGKGNEVSMQMYGVKLFNEKYYFPLRSAGQYMERAKEADLKKQQGQISIVNSGFTKATTPKSSNPVVLSGFTDVWADHVNEMSMYHGFVLPMEDFRRVYNYTSPNVEDGKSVSVNSVIQNAYGEAATGYIDQLYRDLNGGAVSDPRETPAKALMAKFKKAAVFASASVVVQQPSAIGRAFAVIDPKYFIGAKVDHKRHKQLWAEVKKYAPVATIKEMGYFDTGMGKSAQDFLTGKEYGSLKEKAAAFFTEGDYRDEVLGKMPALADELTWCAIWEAAKRETKAKNPKMDVKSEAFLQAAGKRFAEVITKTQVYDSVLSRSANMRSKGAFMSMWTAFMAEPTTTINMVEDALRKAQKGDKKYAARALGAVMTSVVINSLLSSVVYAMRDDDEEETFLEKYVQSFATEILDGINPITYYPFLKDVWSALQGYDIERSDMSLITSLVEKITKLVQVYSKNTEGMDEEELAKYNKSLADAWWGVTDYLTALVGIPVKNVRRDINGAFNMFRTISQDLTDRDTSWGSLIDKTWDDVKNSIPVVGWFPDATAADKLYKATINGDTAYQKRLESAYSSQNSLDNAIRKGLRANDSRVWEAAVAWNENDLEAYKRIAKEIISEGHFSQDNVVMAIQAEAKAMLPKESESTSVAKAKGYFTAEKFAVAVSQGNGTMAATIRADIIDTAMRNGKTQEEAQDSFASSVKTQMEELYLEGGITQKQAIDALTAYCGYDKERAQVIVNEWRAEKETGIAYDDIYDAFLDGKITVGDVRNMYMTYGGLTQEEAEEKVTVLSFVKKNPTLGDISYAAVRDYTDYCEAAGVKPKVFYDAWKYKNSLEGAVKEPMLEYINGLNLTTEQKDSLYFAFGWAESKLRQAPWH